MDLGENIKAAAMKQIILFAILFIVLYGSPLLAQNRYTFSQFGNETIDFIKQPVKWEGEDYLKIGIVGAGTGLSMFADQPIRDAVLKDRKYYYSFPIEFGRNFGELYSPCAFFGGFFRVARRGAETQQLGAGVCPPDRARNVLTRILEPHDPQLCRCGANPVRKAASASTPRPRWTDSPPAAISKAFPPHQIFLPTAAGAPRPAVWIA